jgi:anti-anti-sigma factor
MMDSRFALEITAEGTVLRAAGMLGAEAAPAFRNALREAMRLATHNAPHLVLLDMQEVTFLDSCALGVLLAMRNRLPRGPRLDLLRVARRPLIDLRNADVPRLLALRSMSDRS